MAVVEEEAASGDEVGSEVENEEDLEDMEEVVAATFTAITIMKRSPSSAVRAFSFALC